MWTSNSAVSLNKIRDDLNAKVPLVNKSAFFSSLIPGEVRRPRDVYYFVSEYTITVKQRPRARFMACASQWALSLVDMPDKDRVEIIPHEIPYTMYKAKYFIENPVSISSKRKKIEYNKDERDYILFVSDAQSRKNPSQWKSVVNAMKHKDKIVAVVPKAYANIFPHSYPFGSLDEKDLINLYKKARVTMILSGGEGFGLPALEGAFAYAPPVGNWYPTIDEVFPQEYNQFVQGIERKAKGFILGSEYVYYEIKDPLEVAHMVDNLYDDVKKEDAEWLSDWVEDRYGIMTQYRRFLFTL